MWNKIFLSWCVGALIGLEWVGAAAAEPAQKSTARYCVVVSQATAAQEAWKPVVAALVKRHAATVLTYEKNVAESLPGLKREFPRYACFVAPHAEVSQEFVAQVSQLTRQLDTDPYTDLLWGILTGFDAANALRIAEHSQPLTVERVAAGTEVELPLCQEGLWYCELKQGRMVKKAPGEKPREEKGPADTTQALVETLNQYEAQLFVTSGHATERDWQIGFRYRNGTFQSHAGQLFGVDTQGKRWPVKSANPKVYLPVGNCLMGHMNGPDSMALAFLNSAGVHQMAGYTVPTWYGYAGWGLLDYFVEQPGRYTLAEAFYANQQALVYRLETYFPSALAAQAPAGAEKKPLSPAAQAAGLTAHDAEGLLYDRDVLAFYGDPAWEARMAPAPLAFAQSLTAKEGEYRLEIKPLLAERSFATVNANGSQRGGRPLVQFLPERINVASVKILAGSELKPVITDNFILLPRPGASDTSRTLQVVFRADKL